MSSPGEGGARLRVHKVREAQPMLGYKIFDRGYRLPHVDGHNGEPIVFVALIESFESAPLPYTVGSPGGPKVQEEDFATE